MRKKKIAIVIQWSGLPRIFSLSHFAVGCPWIEKHSTMFCHHGPGPWIFYSSVLSFSRSLFISPCLWCISERLKTTLLLRTTIRNNNLYENLHWAAHMSWSLQSPEREAREMWIFAHRSSKEEKSYEMVLSFQFRLADYYHFVVAVCVCVRESEREREKSARKCILSSHTYVVVVSSFGVIQSFRRTDRFCFVMHSPGILCGRHSWELKKNTTNVVFPNGLVVRLWFMKIECGVFFVKTKASETSVTSSLAPECSLSIALVFSFFSYCCCCCWWIEMNFQQIFEMALGSFSHFLFSLYSRHEEKMKWK